MLNRRTFLKGVGAATVAASIPQLYQEGSVLPVQTAPMNHDITVTFSEDGPWSVVIDAGGHTLEDVYDFYRALVLDGII